MKDPDYPIIEEQELAHKLIRSILKLGKLETYAGFCLAFPKGIKKDRDVWFALSNEGVGTKVLVAQLAKKFRSVGIDVVAMNVNDIICIGAKPLAFSDYLALSEGFPRKFVGEVMEGIEIGAKQADVSVISGETPYLTEMLKGVSQRLAFDLSGASVGLIPREPITGGEIAEGDIVVGLESNGLHSNGFTLARKALLRYFKEEGKGCADYTIYQTFEPSGLPICDEMLKPTKIYVGEIIEAIDRLNIHGLAHITGRGLRKLRRLSSASNIGLVIDNLPIPPPIMQEIQKARNKTNAEMYAIFNMGIGFCVVLPKEEVDDLLGICQRYKANASVIGYTTSRFRGSVKLVLEDEEVIF